MADLLETYDIQLDAVGAEAVQQTLDALGVKAESVNAAASSDVGQASSSPSTGPDLAGVLAALETTNDILRDILAAVRTSQPPPTY